jgi:MFS family permease
MTYRRGWIALFLFSLSTINFMDRIALSIAAKPISVEFGLSAVQMGYLFSAYIWSYGAFIVPMGILIDRYGPKQLAGVGILVWSTATALTGFAGNFAAILVSRFVMGAGESVTNPVGTKVIRAWFPASERGIVTAVFNSGSYAGPAVSSVFLGSLVAMFGWRLSFVIAGAMGLLWLALWLIFFGSPEQVGWLRDEERERIVGEREAGNIATSDDGPGGLLCLLRTPTLWGLALTQGCNVYAQYLFLSWLPSYLQGAFNLSVLMTGILTSVPYVAAVALSILFGRLSDRYLRRYGIATGRRRNAVALAMLFGAVLLLVPVTSNIVLLLAEFSIALAGIASTTPLNFSLLNDLLPTSRHVAKGAAFIVVGGSLFGVMAPIATGHIVAATGSYDWAFVIAGVLMLIGATTVLTMTRRPITAAAHDGTL